MVWQCNGDATVLLPALITLHAKGWGIQLPVEQYELPALIWKQIAFSRVVMTAAQNKLRFRILTHINIHPSQTAFALIARLVAFVPNNLRKNCFNLRIICNVIRNTIKGFAIMGGFGHIARNAKVPCCVVI